MKKSLIMAATAAGIAAIIAVGSFSLSALTTVYALGSRDVELIFIATDGGSGQPIPGAHIDLWIDGSNEEKNKPELVRLTTNNHGIVRMLRKNNMVDDLIKGGRTIRTDFDFTWCMSGTVSSPLKNSLRALL
jgi:hypothetical protein